MSKFFRAVLLCLLIVPGQLSAQLVLDSLYDPETLQADLEQLRELINETHPSPDTFISQEAIDQTWTEAYAEVQNGLTGLEFATLVAQTIRVYKDSHTTLNFGALRKSYVDKNGLFLNLRVRTVENKLCVVEDFEGILEPGTEIKSLNGRSGVSLTNSLAAYSMLEGNSMTGFKRIADALFPNFVGMIHDLDEKNTIVAHNPLTDVTEEISYPAYNSEDIAEIRKERKYNPFKLELYPDSNMAVIKIDSFFAKNGGQYSGFLRKSFKEIRKQEIENVAIDIRGNTGGKANRIGEILAYLNDPVYIVPDNIIARQSPASKKRFDEQLNPISRFIVEVRALFNKDAASYLSVIDLPVGKQDTIYFSRKPKSKRKQEILNSFLFIDGMSASASANLAAIFKTHEIGPVIGESCLGPMSGTWGNPVNVELDNTNLNVLISSIRFNTKNDFMYDATPVQPDNPVALSQLDIANNRDAYLSEMHKVISTREN